ncbi:MAG TPA: hypothetical protein VIH56_06740 [Candidatus Acidoferrales bacterium]
MKKMPRQEVLRKMHESLEIMQEITKDEPKSLNSRIVNFLAMLLFLEEQSHGQ